ncbi:Crp/Fnr family transcriptional regulator [Bacillus sp. CGMCC 1.16607]|uniref:Crp/Fnr family transcriptional regulator n=1 Tax=Bacillus sp. CGMCC 1.16607 TaxID=3351842 RepID=UPI0036408929
MCCQKHHQTDSCVRSVPVFKGLGDEEVQSLNQVVKSQTYHKGEYIFREGEPSETLFVVHKGTIKVSKVSDEGKEQILRILFPGDFIGQYSLMENKKHYADAEVLEETTVCHLQKNDFKLILERNPVMAMNFMMALSELLQMADEWIGTISLLEVERRLAKALLLFFEKENKEEYFELPVPKKDFASLIGATPETLSRKLVHLQTLHVINLDGRRGIHLLNVDKLKEMAE